MPQGVQFVHRLYSLTKNIFLMTEMKLGNISANIICRYPMLGTRFVKE